MYRAIFPLLKLLDAEFAHHAGMTVLKAAQLPGIRGALSAYTRPDPALSTTVMGIDFPTPFGVAAGFDKNAEVVRALIALGFGHVEVGTVTPVAQPGNPAPRLFRLPADQALVNRMGFNNNGVEALATRLRAYRRLAPRPVIGVNIGKNKATPLERAVDDYRLATKTLSPLADYLVINVSSPNTPGLRALQDPAELVALIEAVRHEAGTVPILVKISPDSPDEEIRDICQLVRDASVAGIVATNTTVAREGLRSSPAEIRHAGEGGLSGSPLLTRSRDVLGLARETLGDGATIISVGGVFTGADVQQRLDDGANLVQAYTSFVYRGPLLAHHVNQEILKARG